VFPEAQDTMTFHPAAFRVHKYAKLASAETIRMLQAQYAENELLYCEPAMDQHAGKLVRVVQNAWPIPGVAYRLEEVLLEEKRRTLIPGIWSEEAIVDHALSIDIESEPFGQLAADLYTATADNEEGVGMVSIHDHAGRLVCGFRNNDAKFAADAVNQIARLRCRIGFEMYFGFDGHYPDRNS
jgi:hypothetical protein